MKRIMLGILAVALVAGTVWAAEEKAGSTAAAPTVLTGTLVDNTCAGANKADLGAFVKTHTKDCALMPGCTASGYSLYTPDGKLHKFSKASNAKVVEFLKGAESTLTVEVTVKSGAKKKLELVSIKNQS
jgi:hypothetical protein